MHHTSGEDPRSIRGRRLLGVAILLMAVAVSAVLYIRVWLPMREVLGDTEAMRAWVASKGWSARLLYAAAVCLQVVAAVIPGEPFELCAGYVFGPLEGTLICLAGIFVGSMIVFALARAFGRRFVCLFISEEKLDSVRFLQDADRLFVVTAVLMICPGTPKDLLTYCAGLTRISPVAWIVICSVGRIPSVVTSTWGGSAIAEGDFLKAGIIFAVTALLCLGGILLFRKHSRDYEAKRARHGKGD